MLGGVVILAIVFVTSLNVAAFALDKFARLFGAHVGALPGYEDFVRLAISAAALMFFPYCQLRRGHVVVELLSGKRFARYTGAIDRFWLGVTGGAAFFLAYWIMVGALETRADGVLSPVLGWREWPFYLPGAVSLVLWGLVALGQSFSKLDADV